MAVPIDDRPRGATAPARSRPLRRLAALAASLGAGGAVGVLGHALSGDERWFLAVPLAVVVAWWRVADPTRCAGSGCAIGDERRPRA